MQPAFVILGAGQDGGSPQLGQRSGIGPPRTASSVAIATPAGSVVLLDASPDIRHQGNRLLEWNRYPANREAFLDAVAVTHAHTGHYVGLVHFGPEAANTHGLRILATSQLFEHLYANDPFRPLLVNGHLKPSDILEPFAIDASTTIAGIPVPHRAEYTDTVAISVTVHGEPWLCYLPDIDSWEEWPAAERVLSAHRYALVDATFASADEIPGRDIGAVPHPLVGDTMERFAHLTDRTTIILTHINHTNPVADPASPLAQRARASGFSVAYDGLSFPDR